MPKPKFRPAALLRGHANSAIRPTNTAVTNGCQRFSNRIWAKPVFRGFNAMVFLLVFLNGE